MNEEKIKEVLSDEEFVKELVQLESAEQVQAALEEKGVKLTLEEIKAIGKAVVKMAEADGELSEEELEEVTGGSWLLSIAICVAVVAFISAIEVGNAVAPDMVRSWGFYNE